VAEGLDPLSEAFEAFTSALSGILGIDKLEAERLTAKPPREEYGDLGFPLMRYLRRLGLDASSVLERVQEGLRASGVDWARLEVSGGFLNLRLDAPRAAERLLSLLREGWRPRPPRTPRPLRVVVEHTSANPIHPLHMGHARNSSLGDSLSRLLSARGHVVNRRFYVNDAGLQAAYAVLGFKILGIDPLEASREAGLKPDELVGWVYATTTTLVDAEKARREGAAGEELEELASSLARLREREPLPGLFDKLFNAVKEMEDPESEVSRIVREVEFRVEPTASLARRVAEAALQGIRETLSRFGVEFDAWDWETDLLWEGRVARILEEARRSRYYTRHKGAEALDIPRIIRELVVPDPEVRESIKLPRGFDVPPLILTRSDGTTLYTTRDIAYTLYKFEAAGADRVINVIGAEQRLPQLQLRLALLGLGYKREALNLIHYDYEMVNLPGRRMRSRRGILVTLDEVLDEAKARAVEEVRARNPGAPREWVEEVAEKVAVGAIKFALLRTSAPRPVTLDLDKILDFRENSGPYLQYTYARAVGILSKHGPIDYQAADPRECGDPRRRGLMIEALRTPLVMAKAADDLAPEDLATHLLGLADRFNSWYQVESVIHDPDEGSRECKAALVELVRKSLEEGLGALGIPLTPRM
jgi:arginyl-tRNA synthetase